RMSPSADQIGASNPGMSPAGPAWKRIIAAERRGPFTRARKVETGRNMESAPLARDLRMEKKRRPTKVGISCIVAGVILLGIGGFGLMRGGADILGVWGLLMGAALVATGAYTMYRASTQRW